MTAIRSASGIVSVWIVLIGLSAVPFLSGCPASDSAYKLPEGYSADAITVKMPKPECIWPRAGGSPENLNVSSLDGPISFGIQWEVSLGEGAVLSPVVDEDGRIYAGFIGGPLFCLSPEGEKLWVFGEQTETDVVSSALRAQPALGDGQVWLACDSGLILLDYSGKEVWRFDSKYLPEGGIINLALSPKGGVAISARDGSIILFDATGAPKATVKTNGAVPSPASFNKEGVALFSSTDQFVYIISSDGRLSGKLSASGAFLATPVVTDDWMIAVCNDGVVYGGDFQGRERWRSDLIYDASAQKKILKKENEDAMLGLYWSPLFRTLNTESGEETKGNGKSKGNEFELVAPFVDRPKQLCDASIIFSWIGEKGMRRMRKVMADSFIAKVNFGAQPVMDVSGRIYFAWDNKVAVSLGKDVLSEFTIEGPAVVSGAQPVITRGKKLLLPMSDGRLICLGESEETGNAEEADETSEGEDVTDGSDDEELAEVVIESMEDENAGESEDDESGNSDSTDEDDASKG